ncbi:MAG: nitroreductase family protein [Phototrophicales bacterium]|nr:nitroreductase family protein [Phototrophicales bacterium]
MSEERFQLLKFTHLTPEEQLTRSAEFLSRMKTRRTVRDFSSDPVSFELIRNAIATANTAPSGANQQPWTFAVVSNKELKYKIRVAAEAEEKENYQRRMKQEWLEVLQPLGTDWMKAHIEDAPYLIIVFAQSHGIRMNPDTGENTTYRHYYVTESVGIAVGMLLASLHLAGLATLTHTPSPMAFLSDILNRLPNERAFVLIPVGYPAEGARIPNIAKKSVDEVMVVYD